MKDLGTLRYFLELEIARNDTGITLCQRKYALDLLTETGYLGCKPSSTPMEPNLKISKDDGEPLCDITSYRRLIEKLLYLTVTRPYICYSVNRLSQFLAAPRTSHLQAALRILQYIKRTPGQGLFFPSSSTIQIKAFSDADWGTCPDTRRSLTDPNINYEFCVASLESDSSSHSAKNLQQLGQIAIELDQRNVTSTTSYTKRLLKSKKNNLDPFVKAALQDCLELYSDAIPTLKEAIEDYRNGHYDDANVKLSSVLDASTTCEDGFKEKKGVVSPLTGRNDDVFQLSAISLSIINMLKK
ncbi:putative invertase inhibitor [Carica papaya]|uniref:putative invertase inhibitor n=1 Tax=Carica papaya TaxID=3649 RepID=UPI000B8CACB7|nr:putative invertase inhibitor [Carica papaya]